MQYFAMTGLFCSAYNWYMMQFHKYTNMVVLEFSQFTAVSPSDTICNEAFVDVTHMKYVYAKKFLKYFSDFST